MKICFYSPYLPKHFGGGEKHFLDVACAAAREHEVSIAVSSNNLQNNKFSTIKTAYEKFSGHDLAKITFIETPLGSSAHFFKKLFWTKNFDAIYYVTDGSLFFSLAKNNFLHIQIPFTNSMNSVVDIFKLKNWKHRNANSFFTKQIVEKSWNTTIDTVLYPTVKISELSSEVKKEKIILNVGRFFRKLHSKRQDLLVHIFKRLLEFDPKLTKGWQLYLVGASEDDEYVAFVKKIAEGLPIVLIPSCSRAELVELYKRASVYWHAAGFEMDEAKHPEMVEHFGITTIEAMAAGAVPVVVEKGGQREILENFPELGWESEDECVEKTLQLLRKPALFESLKEKVKKRAADFEQKIFEERVKKLFTV